MWLHILHDSRPGGQPWPYDIHSNCTCRPTERGGRWGYFPGARTNRGPRALVNVNVAVICLCTSLLLQSILCYQNA